MFAKLFIAVGFLVDLAAVLHKPSQQMSRGSPRDQREDWDWDQYP